MDCGDEGVLRREQTEKELDDGESDKDKSELIDYLSRDYSIYDSNYFSIGDWFTLNPGKRFTAILKKVGVSVIGKLLNISTKKIKYNFRYNSFFLKSHDNNISIYCYDLILVDL